MTQLLILQLSNQMWSERWIFNNTLAAFPQKRVRNNTWFQLRRLNPLLCVYGRCN